LGRLYEANKKSTSEITRKPRRRTLISSKKGILSRGGTDEERPVRRGERRTEARREHSGGIVPEAG